MLLHRTADTEYVGNYLLQLDQNGDIVSITSEYEGLRKDIERYMDATIEAENKGDNGVTMQHGALLGKPENVRYYYDRIHRYLRDNNIKNVIFPRWYKSLADAVFHDNWGFGPVANWFDLEKSQSAKIIGSLIWYQIDGRMQLQPQRISPERKAQLRDKLLMIDPEKTKRDANVEVSLLNGVRVAIFSKEMAKPGQDIMVFRNYILNRFTYEELAERGTIPGDSVQFYKSFAKTGFNVLIGGAPKVGKTSFLQIWQSYEDPSLEGVLIEETDELKMHLLIPGAPIMQILVNDENRSSIVKSLMRSDADYLVLAEARTGEDFNLAVALANKGTRRCKTSFHTTEVIKLPYFIASEIAAVRPNAQMEPLIMSVSSSFHYVIQMMQLSNKEQKRVESIHEIVVDKQEKAVYMYRLCEYNIETDSWSWSHHIDDRKIEIAKKENYADFLVFDRELRSLAAEHPMRRDNCFISYQGEKQ